MPARRPQTAAQACRWTEPPDLRPALSPAEQPARDHPRERGAARGEGATTRRRARAPRRSSRASLDAMAHRQRDPRSATEPVSTLASDSTANCRLELDANTTLFGIAAHDRRSAASDFAAASHHQHSLLSSHVKSLCLHGLDDPAEWPFVLYVQLSTIWHCTVLRCWQSSPRCRATIRVAALEEPRAMQRQPPRRPAARSHRRRTALRRVARPPRGRVDAALDRPRRPGPGRGDRPDRRGAPVRRGRAASSSRPSPNGACAAR